MRTCWKVRRHPALRQNLSQFPEVPSTSAGLNSNSPTRLKEKTLRYTTSTSYEVFGSVLGTRAVVAAGPWPSSSPSQHGRQQWPFPLRLPGQPEFCFVSREPHMTRDTRTRSLRRSLTDRLMFSDVVRGSGNMCSPSGIPRKSNNITPCGSVIFPAVFPAELRSNHHVSMHRSFCPPHTIFSTPQAISLYDHSHPPPPPRLLCRFDSDHNGCVRASELFALRLVLHLVNHPPPAITGVLVRQSFFIAFSEWMLMQHYRLILNVI